MDRRVGLTGAVHAALGNRCLRLCRATFDSCNALDLQAPSPSAAEEQRNQCPFVCPEFLKS